MKELDIIDISVRDKNSVNGRKTLANASGEALKGRRKNQLIKRRRKKRKQKKYNARHSRQNGIRMVIMLLMLLFILLFCFLLYRFLTGGFQNKSVRDVFNSQRRELIRANKTERPLIQEALLTPNPYSRPGIELEKVNNIFVHYTANRGTSAAQNRSYFENLGITGETSASAHFVIGYEGEIIQCLPLSEIGYAVKQRNYDSISIECCYLSDDGEFTDATYQSLLALCGWLLREYKLTPREVLRHYDEGGKKCPLYYVEHEEKWEEFLRDLETYILEEQV